MNNMDTWFRELTSFFWEGGVKIPESSLHFLGKVQDIFFKQGRGVWWVSKMERQLFSMPIRIPYAKFRKLQRAIRFIISEKIEVTSPLDNGMNYLRTGDGFLLSIILNTFLCTSFYVFFLIAEHGQFACHVKKPEKSPSMIGFTKTYPPTYKGD